MTADERIARNYKRLRTTLGITQGAAAARAKACNYSLSKEWISAIENSRRPASGQLDALAASIGVDMSQLTMPPLADA